MKLGGKGGRQSVVQHAKLSSRKARVSKGACTNKSKAINRARRFLGKKGGVATSQSRMQIVIGPRTPPLRVCKRRQHSPQNPHAAGMCGI
mmetsp:Transcript_26159/g.39754  ORF Transcript_26159/g.39754 Transcript_26159/m.39754 type:complete len:90 (-) Transcript_26159:45-314(-)